MEPSDEPSSLHDVLRVFSSQYGVASDAQVRCAGVSWERQQALVRRGIWLRHCHGVLRDAAAPTSWHQRAIALNLLPGGASYLGAGAGGRLHALDGCLEVEQLTAVIGQGTKVAVPPGARLIRARRLSAADVTVVDGIAVTSIAVTLIHLQVYGPHAEQALDSALRQGLRPDEFRAVLQRWRGAGVQGPREMLAMLHDRVDARLPRSWFQRLASRLLAEHGLTFVDEWPLHDHRGVLRAEFDLADVELQVGVECQSWEHHGSPAAQRRDTDRKRLVRTLGWEVVELWWSDLHRMDEVITDILEVVDRARIVAAHRSLRG